MVCKMDNPKLQKSQKGKEINLNFFSVSADLHWINQTFPFESRKWSKKLSD